MGLEPTVRFGAGAGSVFSVTVAFTCANTVAGAGEDGSFAVLTDRKIPAETSAAVSEAVPAPGDSREKCALRKFCNIELCLLGDASRRFVPAGFCLINSVGDQRLPAFVGPVCLGKVALLSTFFTFLPPRSESAQRRGAAFCQSPALNQVSGDRNYLATRRQDSDICVIMWRFGQTAFAAMRFVKARVLRTASL